MAKIKFDDTREKILNVAENLFGKFGFHKTSMDEIARTSRKAKGSLYYHFESKEELFGEVVEKELGKLRKELSVILTDKSVPANERLMHFVRRRMEVMKDTKSYHELIKADFYEHFDFVDDVRVKHEEWEKGNLAALFKEGQETGVIVSDLSPEVLADILVMLETSMEIPFFLQDKYSSYEPYFAKLSNMMIKGLS